MKVHFGAKEIIMIAPSGIKIGDEITHKTEEIKTGKKLDKIVRMRTKINTGT